MQMTTIAGTIRRRILLNYRIRPAAVASLLPEGLRPKLRNGWAIAGVCLIRLENTRPAFFPFSFGHSSENAAHRIAVTWTQHGILHDGVFIPRRDSDSWINQLIGGRLFPGQHHAARFQVVDSDGHIEFSMRSDDGGVVLGLSARECSEFPRDSVFSNLAEASDFFREGQDGYSTRRHAESLDGVRLLIKDWQVTPLAVE